MPFSLEEVILLTDLSRALESSSDAKLVTLAMRCANALRAFNETELHLCALELHNQRYDTLP
jgi:hypothetical protein